MAARQKKKSGKAKTRKDAVVNLWTRPAQPANFGREQFRFRVNRSQRRLPTLDIDPWVQTVNWRRVGSARTGDLNFTRPMGAHTASLLAYGDHVLCQWSRWGKDGPWSDLWRMKIATPQQQLQARLITLTLDSQLDSLTKSKVAWKFRTDKSHPHGWDARQITLHVCGRFHIPILSIPRNAERKIHKYAPKSASPLDVITWAWGQERIHTGRRFDIDSSTGLLRVSELQEPQYMLIMGAAMLDATVSQAVTGIASAMIATATHKGAKGKRKAKKLRVRIVDMPRERQYGYIVRTARAPAGIQSTAELRRWAKNRLAALHGIKRSLDFSHPGIPLMDRGTPMRVYLPEADLSQIVFATEVEHSLSAGSYEMQVSVGFDDPWAADLRKARVQQKKDAAAARRARKKSAEAKKHPKPGKARTRGKA